MRKTKILTWWHETVEVRKTGRIRQKLFIKVQYDGECITPISMELYEDGKYVAEISKLMDKAEGSPLNAMLDAINWDDLYADELASEEEAGEPAIYSANEVGDSI